jgi:hypothetical protein
MFKKGLIHGAYVLALTITIIIICKLIGNPEVSVLLTGITEITSWLVIGYFFKKNNGSIISIITEPNKIKGFFYYVLGAGILWGPAKLYSTGEYPIPDFNPIFNVILFLISIPMMGMSLIGVLIVGGFFYKEK